MVVGDQAIASSRWRLLSWIWAPGKSLVGEQPGDGPLSHPPPVGLLGKGPRFPRACPHAVLSFTMGIVFLLPPWPTRTPSLVSPTPKGTALLPTMPVWALHCLGKTCTRLGGLLLACDEVKGPEWGT